CPCGSLEVGTIRHDRYRSTATSGRLMKNTDPHQNHLSIRPDRSGPSAPPAPASPAHVATAFARSCGGKELWMIDSVAGITSAAPMPMTARAAISWAGEVAKL